MNGKNAPVATMVWFAIAICTALAASAQEPPTVVAVPERTEVYVGEPFIFQLQVENVGEASPPDLAAQTEDFTVEFAGGKRESNESIAFINGRTTRVSSQRYLINYQLTARREGTLEIPALEFTAAGHTLRTQPVTIQATPPRPNEDFRLVTKLSKETCFAGEPIAMSTTYYIGGQVRDVLFSLPVLQSDQFHAEPIQPEQEPGREYYQIAVNGEEVIAVKDTARVDGQQFITLTFQHVLVPRAAGNFTIDGATVSAQALVGQRRSRSPFDNPFFGSRDQFQSVIVPAEPVTLAVRPVPEAGKPADFSGLIGSFKLSASASPTNVNVGDPITLTLALEGSNYLRHFELPPLQQQPALAERFRIPEEMAPGRAEGNQKIFTQTLRAQSDAVTEIPPITLSYFDTRTGQYAVAATEPIALTVKAAPVVTAADAEGYQRQVETVEHVAVDEGIAHNFNGADALRPQRFGPDVWLRTGGSWMFLLLPPIAWAALAAGVFAHRLGALQPMGRARKRARLDLEQALANAGDGPDAPGRLLHALRAYLGLRLAMKGGALTYGDVEPPLRARGATAETLALLKSLFEACEASHYAGGGASVAADLAERIRACADALEKEVG